MDIRIQPVDSERVSIQVNCSCGNSRTRRDEEIEPEFKHVAVTGTADFSLQCSCCRKVYQVRVQGNHFHVNEVKARVP